MKTLLPALVLALGLAAATESVAQVEISCYIDKKSPRVEYRQGGASTWTALIGGPHRLTPGDLARTNATGKAQVHLAPVGVALTVGKSTQFSVVQVLEQFAKVDLSHGRADVEVEPRDVPDRFQVVTPNATLSAQGTAWIAHYVSLTPDPETGLFPGQDSQPEDWPGETEPGHTRAQVTKGTVEAIAMSTGETRLVKEGEMVDIPPDGPIMLTPFNPRSGAGAIERGTVGEGETGGAAGPAEDGPVQPNAGTTQPQPPSHNSNYHYP